MVLIRATPSALPEAPAAAGPGPQRAAAAVHGRRRIHPEASPRPARMRGRSAGREAYIPTIRMPTPTRRPRGFAIWKKKRLFGSPRREPSAIVARLQAEKLLSQGQRAGTKGGRGGGFLLCLRSCGRGEPNRYLFPRLRMRCTQALQSSCSPRNGSWSDILRFACFGAHSKLVEGTNSCQTFTVLE
jgi:hypothetical protein